MNFFLVITTCLKKIPTNFPIHFAMTAETQLPYLLRSQLALKHLISPVSWTSTGLTMRFSCSSVLRCGERPP